MGFENWPDRVLDVLKKYYVPELVGPAIRRWTWREPESVDPADSLGSLARLGGNVDSRVLHLDRRPFDFRQLPGGRTVMGTAWPEGSVLLQAPTWRFPRRGGPDASALCRNAALEADFKAIVHGATPENVRWVGACGAARRAGVDQRALRG